MSKRITIGDIIERLKTELFPNPKTELEKLCREREMLVKQYLNITHQLIMQNINYRTNYEGKLPHWKDNRVDNHIKNLSEHTELLALELDKDKSMFNTFEPDYMFLMFNSVHGSILSDIMWAGDITMFDTIELSTGNLDFEELGKYLPNKIQSVKGRFIPYLKESMYQRHVEAMEEVLKCADQKMFRACNLLLMTVIEGIVRDLAHFLNEKQELNYDLTSEKFNSLDSLLRKGEWKEDYEISISKLEMLTRSKAPIVLNYSIPVNFEKLGIGFGKKTKINLKTRLDFLRRRFKEDRDLILHGLSSEYGSNWHLFIDFSALGQVFETMQYYDKLYGKEK